MKTYRAKELGFDGYKLRDEGEIFTADIPPGSWLEEIGSDGNPVEAWSAPPAPSAPPGQEPGPLDGSIEALTAYLGQVTDVLAIDALLAAETAGKSRVGAIKALEERKAELTAT